MMHRADMRVKPSMLCERLPDTISVGGVRYKLITDFRRWILLCELFAEDQLMYGLDGALAADCAAMLVCPDIRHVLREEPTNAVDFISEIGWFALMGEESRTSQHPISCSSRAVSVGKNTQIFDFEIDSERIFASFWAVYGIDLTAVNMHWWKFMALLRCLPRDSAFMQVVGLRGTDTAEVADDGLRRQIRRARAAFRIRKNPEIQKGENGWQMDQL